MGELVQEQEPTTLPEPKQKKEPLWTRQFILVMVTNFFLFFSYHMLFVLVPLHFRSLGAHESLLGLVAGVWTVASVLIRPFMGAAVDRYGRYGILAVGILIMTVSSICFFFMPYLSLVLIIRFVQGIGWAMANTASPTLAADNVPQSRFAEGMGWFTQGNALASIIAPWLSLTLFYYFTNDASVSLIVSAAFLIISLIGSQVLSRMFNKKKGVRTTDEKPEEESVVAAALQEEQQTEQISDEQKKRTIADRLFDLIERRAVLPALAMFFVTICHGTVTSFVPTMAELKIEGNVAQLYFLVQAITLCIVRPLFGTLVDRVGYKIPALIGLLFISASMALLGWSYSLVTLLIAAPFYAIGYALCYAVFLALSVGGIEPQRRGAAMATFFIGFDGGQGLGAVIAGFFVGALGSGAFGFSGMFYLWTVVPILGIIVFYGGLSLKKRREKAALEPEVL